MAKKTTAVAISLLVAIIFFLTIKTAEIADCYRFNDMLSEIIIGYGKMFEQKYITSKVVREWYAAEDFDLEFILPQDTVDDLLKNQPFIGCDQTMVVCDDWREELGGKYDKRIFYANENNHTTASIEVNYANRKVRIRYFKPYL